MKRFLEAPYRFALCWTALLLTAFGWALLDTFVIPHRERIGAEVRQTIAKAAETLAPDGQAGAQSAVEGTDAQDQYGAAAEATDTSYRDGAIEIQIQTFQYESTTCYAADVRLGSPDLLKAAFAEDTYGRNIRQPTSEIAAQNSAVLAINGDYYGSRNSGYVLRNGVCYRAASGSADALLVDMDGNFFIAAGVGLTAEQAAEMWQVFSFGPALVVDGAVGVEAGDEVAQAKLSNPRTAIGQIGPLHYLFLVSDGRTEESEGLSLLDLAEIMRELGCQTAYNLDGGGSSTMVFMGEVVNRPTTNGRSISERAVSDIVYIGH